MPVPEHVTQRLRLRPVQLTDLDNLYKLWTQKDLQKYLWGGQPVSREHVLLEIKNSLESFQARDFGLWIIFLKEKPVFVGFVSLRFNSPQTAIEFFYGIDRKFRGKGLATEAANVIFMYAFQTLQLDKIVAIAEMTNKISVRVLSKLGMKFKKGVRKGERIVGTFSLSRKDFG